MKKIVLLVLTMTVCDANAREIEGAKERIRQVIADVRENPRPAAPIGTHPKKRNKVFSRTFNTTVSSRAYFQLHTDPALDDSSSEMLEKVAQYYLDHPEQLDDADGPYWAGEYHSACLAKFGINGTERKGAIARKSEKVMLEYMVAFLNHWSRLGLYDLSLKHQTFAYPSTENHWWAEVVVCWGYLLALKDDPDFKDRILKDGKSLQEHYERTAEYMKHHMNQRARKGFLLEISSPSYFRRMHAMWYIILDLSPDKELRDLARNTLDLFWAFWAEEQVSGERGGGKVRSRGYSILDGSERVKLPAWIYFGTGQQDLPFIKGPEGSAQLHVQYTALFSGHLPDPVIYEILKDRKEAPPFSITQRRLGREDKTVQLVPKADRHQPCLYNYEEADCLKYSWVTTGFVMGTVMRPPKPYGYWQRGTAQGWAHGLIIAGKAPAIMPERVIPITIHVDHRDILSDQYAVQSKGSFMTRKLPEVIARGQNNKLNQFGVFISKGLKPEYRGDFVFIDSPTCWVAIRAVGTRFLADDQPLKEAHRELGDFYLPEDNLQPVIIEAAAPGDYGDFAEFKSRATQAKLLSEGGAHTYGSLSGDQFTMFDDRRAPLINGKPIDYNPPMAYDSRYVKSEWDSGRVTISVGGTEKVLDFMVD